LPGEGLDGYPKTGERIAETRGGGPGIANAAATHAGRTEAGLSLLFAPGRRPSADDVVRFAQGLPTNRGAAGFAVSHRPDDKAGWLELLASGLTFDLTGLLPAAPESLPECQTMIGFQDGAAVSEIDAVRLMPGAHLAGGEAILPIVRVHAALAANLAELPGVIAIAWHPARTWIEPDYFVRVVSAWLDGGVFPALGLTALTANDNGEFVTQGLAFFIGRELKVPGGIASSAAETAKLAMRLVHHMVEAGRDSAAGPYVTEQGQAIEVGECDDDRFLEVRRRDA
jgi:hypothetical protein